MPVVMDTVVCSWVSWKSYPTSPATEDGSDLAFDSKLPLAGDPLRNTNHLVDTVAPKPAFLSQVGLSLKKHHCFQICRIDRGSLLLAHSKVSVFLC